MTAFGFDPEGAVAFLRAADETLAGLIEEVGPFSMKVEECPDVFSALVETIVHQQLHGKAATAIHRRICTLFSDGAAPTAAALRGISDDQLRGAGLSTSKLLALRDLAERVLDGGVPELEECRALEDEDLIDRLVEVRGIGRWSAEMFLIFRLGRPDVLPVGDFAVRRGYGVAFGTPEPPAPRDLLEYGERWRPYRTVASWYLWRASERRSGSG